MADDKIITLKQERARAFTELRQMSDAAEAEGRNFNADEQQKYDNVRDGVRDLDARIERIAELKVEAAKQERYANQLDGGQAGDKRDDDAATVAREYRDAFNAYMRQGVAEMDADQRRVLMQGQNRDGLVVGTTTLGGFTVPQDFSDRLFSLKIQAGAVRKTKVNVFRTADGRDMPVPIVTAHGAATILTEATAPSVTDETVAQVTLHAFPFGRLEKISIQLLQDSAFQLDEFVGGIIGQKVARLQNLKYVLGGGTTEPVGMANFSGVAELETAAAAGPTADEAQGWFYKLGPAYRDSAEFIMHDTLVQAISLLKATTGTYLWQPSLRDDNPDMFMGRPVYNDPDLQATGTDEHVCGIFADFNNFYTIRDVNEFNVMRLTERYADSLQVGILGWQRSDGTVIDTAAGAQLAVGSG